MMSLPPSLGSPYPWFRELKSEERGLYLIQLLLACGNYVAAGNLEAANDVLEHISQLASPYGDTMQRISAYFAEALADRVIKSWPGLYKALRATTMNSVSEEFIARKLFFDLFPFLKVAYVLTNQAICEAMNGEKMIHIIDLNAVEPAQWIALLQAFSARHEGPPHLRITGVHPQKEVLDQTAHKLTQEAEKLDVPFQFNSVVSRIENLDIEKLRVKTGEALAVSSVFQLHPFLATDDEHPRRKSTQGSENANGAHLPRLPQVNQSSVEGVLEKDGVNGRGTTPDSTSSSPLPLNAGARIDGFLNALRGLSPNVMVITEQDSNHNGSTLMERMLEALHSYAALFDCLESVTSRTSVERLKVEKILFGKEIKNIVACEGFERKERHEKVEKWIQRLEVARFSSVPLSFLGMLQARRLLQGYNCDGYKLKEKNGYLLLCWQDRPLYSVSAWRGRK